MSRLTRFTYFIIAFISISTGIGLLFYKGLPERADFTGNELYEIGYVAPEINHRAPPFSLTNVDFQPISLDRLEGKPVIINFWATWCVPCRQEMPELQALYEQYQDEIHLLGINLGESPQDVAQWIKEFNLTYTILLDPLQSIAQLYQIRGQPSTYILDTNLTIQAIYYGAVPMEQLEHELNIILNSQ